MERATPQWLHWKFMLNHAPSVTVHAARAGHLRQCPPGRKCSSRGLLTERPHASHGLLAAWVPSRCRAVDHAQNVGEAGIDDGLVAGSHDRYFLPSRPHQDRGLWGGGQSVKWEARTARSRSYLDFCRTLKSMNLM